jgi:hypothetical protein
MKTIDRLAAPIRHKIALKEFEVTDALIRSMALAQGSQEVAYPALIAREVLCAAEYDRAFPHLLMAGTAPGIQMSHRKVCSTPTIYIVQPGFSRRLSVTIPTHSLPVEP